MTTALVLALWTGFAVMVYSHVVYPIALLAAAARTAVRQPRNHRSGSTPTVAVIVAAHNEEAHIRARIENLLAQDYPQERLAVIVGSDGSTDHTVGVARSVRDGRVSVEAFTANRGKASVLNDLISATNADLLVFTDANTSFRLDTVRVLAEAIEAGSDVVCGELRLVPREGDTNVDSSYWSIERRLKRGEASFGALLGANGAVYAMRRSAFRPIPPDTICDDFVIAMAVATAGSPVAYASNAVAYEYAPGDMGSEFQRRVRIGIGNYQALFRHPEYLTRAPWGLRLSYVSHKVLRWLTPHFLVLVLGCSVALAAAGDSIYLLIALAQVLGYSSLALAFAMRRRIAWPRIIRMAMLFALLNAAFLVAFARYVTGNFQGSWVRTERQEART